MADEYEKKIEGLKKAYAEIILNSSKEAAARIMMADNKARRFEAQFLSLKEESLSMLVRMKDQFNNMVMEAEAKSLKQQMKIDELEAQLNEAEGIIVDLRSELNQVQEELEIERQNRKKPFNEHILVTNEPVQECWQQDNVPNSCFITQAPDSKCVLIDSENKTAYVNPRLLNKQLSQTLDSTNFSVESHLDQFHGPSDDFSSIIMQNRDSDLCKNGCTQRIRAFEGNLSNGKLITPPSEDKKFLSQVQPRDKTANHMQHASQNVNPCSEPLCSSEMDNGNANYIQYGWLKRRRSSCKKGIRSRRSAQKNVRYREAIASLKSSRKKFGKPQIKPFFFPLKPCFNIVNVETVEVPIGLIELEPKKTKYCHVSDKFNRNSEDYASCSSSGQSHGAPDDTQVDSMLIDVPILEGFGSSDHQLSRSETAFKFTFQRKRRKNVLEKIDENISHDGVPMKRLENPADVSMVEIGILKDEKYKNCEKIDQVAHQPISSTGVQC